MIKFNKGFIMMLKIFVIGAILVGFIHAEGPKTATIPKEVVEALKNGITKCGTPADDPVEILTSVGVKRIYRQDQHFRELLHCTYRTIGLVHENGRFNISAATGVRPGDKDFEKAVNECDVVGSTPVETTFLSVKCFLKKYVFDFEGIE